MGYRSQVVLAVDEAIVPAFMAMLAKETQAHDFCFANSDEVITGYTKKGSFLFRWDHIKWYDTFPEVQAIEAFMEAATENDLSDYGEKTAPLTKRMNMEDAEGEWSEHFRFLRIGEEYGDVEEWGYGFDIYMNRAIDY
tara:strand:- start:57 stop:470 length:414 start_codon:yes stop_codon:yes gene_type:complete